MEYSASVEKILASNHVKVGDNVRIEKDDQVFEGTIMPNTGDPSVLVLKLKNGYNIGLQLEGSKIKKLEKESKEKPAKKLSHEHDSGKKTIMIIHTGGTIASKIDYETGAVHAAFGPEEIISSIPELAQIANIRTEMIFQMFSEDMEPSHWVEIAKHIVNEIGRADGFIVTHGTDTMHYTAAALSFMLNGIEKPVILVGSQRSSDRGSSDASMNLTCAAHFIANSDFTGVGICMHSSMNDDSCYIHSGLHARKMHTSRRDAFKSIDVMPVAKVSRTGHVEMIEYQKNPAEFKPVFGFEKKVALVKLHPGFDKKILEYYAAQGYKGIILEGTGLGHAPINETDEKTKHHNDLLETLKTMSSNGTIIAMTSQCIFGKINMNVYSTGRKLIEAGVLPAAMTPETAYVKLGWVLAHSKNSDDTKRMFLQNIAGEIVERIDPRAFIE